MNKHKGMLKCVCCRGVMKCCPFNKGRQKYCADCRKVKDKEKKRRYYNKRYREDKAYQEAERIRSKAFQQACRKAVAAPEKVELANNQMPSFDIMLFAHGITAELIDSEDPAEIAEAAKRYERRGQRVASISPGALHSTKKAGF